MASFAEELSAPYKLCGYRVESCCSHLCLRYYACFEQGVPGHSGKYRVKITIDKPVVEINM